MTASPAQTGPRRSARALAAGLQIAATFALLGWALSHVDRARLSPERLQPVWLGLALACTLPAYAAAALRWSFTAQRLGLALPFRHALPEVYLASLLNSVLPSGVAGDVLRVARSGRGHGAGAARYRSALLSVAIERGSGQALLWLVLALSLASGPLRPQLPAWALPAAGLALALGLLVRLRRAAGELDARAPAAELTLGTALRRALLADGAPWVQLGSSALVLAACTLGFACSARGLSVPLSFAELCAIVPPLLALSALPLSIGGFGVREAAGAALYAQSGLDAATGIAVAATFGLANLIGSAPGALWLLRAAEPAR